MALHTSAFRQTGTRRRQVEPSPVGWLPAAEEVHRIPSQARHKHNRSSSLPVSIRVSARSGPWRTVGNRRAFRAPSDGKNSSSRRVVHAGAHLGRWSAAVRCQRGSLLIAVASNGRQPTPSPRSDAARTQHCERSRWQKEQCILLLAPCVRDNRMQQCAYGHHQLLMPE